MKNRARTGLHLLLTVVAVLVVAAGANAEVSSTPDPLTLSANDEVLAFTHDDATGITYFGGRFTSVGVAGGPSFATDPVSGRQANGWPAITGSAVYALTPDGAGGMYVGGSFTAVGGLNRNNLAHLRADRTVDPVWNPAPNGAVRVITVGPTSLYVAGDFTVISSVQRNALAQLGIASGLASPWDPKLNGNAYQPGAGVNALQVNGAQVVAGGSFASIGGAPRSNLAAIDASGAATPWNPAPDGAVSALAQTGGKLYVAGSFGSLGGAVRMTVGAVDLATGLATSWSPTVTGYVTTVTAASGSVYLGGLFSASQAMPVRISRLSTSQDPSHRGRQS